MLAINQDIQRKVQEECDRVLRESNGKVTYEAIQSMEYTDKVIHGTISNPQIRGYYNKVFTNHMEPIFFAETLRFYPPVGVLTRAPLRDCKLPTTDVVLKKGTTVIIPVLALHMDPQYFPDPEKFDPERFSEEQKASRPPYTYMPFGEGPRICIGEFFIGMLIRVKLLQRLVSSSPVVSDPC